ncbi:MAG: dTDP-glucose 4,6-dehydratase [Longimicrobiales bacterium]
MRILIAGGCGFIGSNFVRHILSSRPTVQVTVLDRLTYAGNLENLADLLHDARLTFIQGDINDRAVVSDAVNGAHAVVNFAAESHVDRSIMDAGPFVRTNVGGTQVLLDVALERNCSRFLQISTDEVYGSLGPSGRFTESTTLAPSSPYSASKAAADLLVLAYVHTHQAPALILRSSNAYGPYQFPEKLIPLMIANALEGKPLPVYGDGQHVRDWIHVHDLCTAVLCVLERGAPGELYNVGGNCEIANLDMVRRILELTGASESLIWFVPDRPGHDRRYAMDHTRISSQLGWQPQHELTRGLAETVAWYRSNPAWLQSVRSGEYRRFYERQYAARLAASARSG